MKFLFCEKGIDISRLSRIILFFLFHISSFSLVKWKLGSSISKMVPSSVNAKYKVPSSVNAKYQVPSSVDAKYKVLSSVDAKYKVPSSVSKYKVPDHSLLNITAVSSQYQKASCSTFTLQAKSCSCPSKGLHLSIIGELALFITHHLHREQGSHIMDSTCYDVPKISYSSALQSSCHYSHGAYLVFKYKETLACCFKGC